MKANFSKPTGSIHVLAYVIATVFLPLHAVAKDPDKLKPIGTVEYFYPGNLANDEDIRAAQLADRGIPIAASLKLGTANKVKVDLQESGDKAKPTFKLIIRFVSPDGRVFRVVNSYSDRETATDNRDLLLENLSNGKGIGLSKRMPVPQKDGVGGIIPFEKCKVPGLPEFLSDMQIATFQDNNGSREEGAIPTVDSEAQVKNVSSKKNADVEIKKQPEDQRSVK